MKRISLLAGALCISMLASGCGPAAPAVTSSPEAAPLPEATLPLNTPAPTETDLPASSTAPETQAPLLIEYSNLSGADTQHVLGDIMSAVGISQFRRNSFVSHLTQFNSIMTPEELTPEFETADPMVPKYDPYELQDRWNETYPDFMGYNCRLTAFSLFGDFITIPEDAPTREDPILFDLDSIAADPDAFPDEAGRFAAFYSAVPTDASKDISVHLENLQKDWAGRGIVIRNDPRIRLISMVFHDMVDEEHPILFIGHTGVLFPIADELWFVEKLAFQEPYQCIRFHSREELNDYLMTRYDLDVDQPNAHPFILENDQLMDGYRTVSR